MFVKELVRKKRGRPVIHLTENAKKAANAAAAREYRSREKIKRADLTKQQEMIKSLKTKAVDFSSLNPSWYLAKILACFLRSLIIESKNLSIEEKITRMESKVKTGSVTKISPQLAFDFQLKRPFLSRTLSKFEVAVLNGLRIGSKVLHAMRRMKSTWS